MITSKYYAIRFLHNADKLSSLALSSLYSMKGKIPSDEWDTASEPIKEITLAAFNINYAISRQFPELRPIEYLGKLERRAKYNIKYQAGPGARAKIIKRGISAKNAYAELAKFPTSDDDAIFWLELDQKTQILFKRDQLRKQRLREKSLKAKDKRKSSKAK